MIDSITKLFGIYHLDIARRKHILNESLSLTCPLQMTDYRRSQVFDWHYMELVLGYNSLIRPLERQRKETNWQSKYIYRICSIYSELMPYKEDDQVNSTIY